MVSIIEPVGGHGGNEFYDFGLCEAIAEQGLKVTLYTCDETNLDLCFEPKTRVIKAFKQIYGKSLAIQRGLRYALGIAISLVDSKRNKSQLAHFHIYHFALREWLAVFCFWLTRTRVVITIHDIESFDRYGEKEGVVSGILSKTMVLMATGVIVHNEFAKSKVLEKFSKFPLDRIDVVPSGDLDFIYKTSISKEEARANLILPQEKQVILFFGQIKKVKGIDILIESLKYFKDESVKLVIVGKVWKDDLESYKLQAQALHLEEMIEWRTAYVSNETVPSYFKAADVVVLPYKIIYNSSVLLRSMDYGVPVVASDLPVFGEIIDSGVNAMLFTSENPKSLSEAILTVLHNKEFASSMALNAAGYIHSAHSRQLIGERMVAAYKKYESI